MSAVAFDATWTAEAGAWGPAERKAYEAHLRELCAPFSPAVVKIEVNEEPHSKWQEHHVAGYLPHLFGPPGVVHERLPDRTTLKARASVAVFGPGADERTRGMIDALVDRDQTRDDAPAMATHWEIAGPGRVWASEADAEAALAAPGRLLLSATFVPPKTVMLVRR